MSMVKNTGANLTEHRPSLPQMAGDEWQWRANPKRRAEAPASSKAKRGFSWLAVNCRLLTSCCGGLTKRAKEAEAGEEIVGGGGARTISGLALPAPSRKDQDPNPESSL